MDASESESGTLRRSLGTATLTLYGVGVIVGAGIFVLVGQIAGRSGPAAWLAFVGASAAALPTALSYAELSSRYPQSAGEAVFAARAFSRPGISFVVGFLVVASGVMSTAAVSHGFADYFRVLVGSGVPRPLLIVAFLGALSVLNARGIRESTWLNAICTTASVLALLTLAFAGASHWGSAPQPLLLAVADVPAGAIASGVALAFYAFIGFEDICNVAEETRDPSRVIPRAILLSLALSAVIYVLVTVTALSVIPAQELARHPAPIALLSERVLPGISSRWLAGVALLAVTNTALFNLIMTSRVLFGMARRGWLPASLAKVSARTRTPRMSVGVAFVAAASFALTGVLEVLAAATNVIILLAFSAVNLSLLVVRLRRVPADEGAGPVFAVPLAVPAAGVVINALLLTQLEAGAYARAAALAGAGVVVHLLVRGRGSKTESADNEA